MGLKEQHEIAVCKSFLREYNKTNDTDIIFLRPGIPKEPDCICSGGLNIEITTAYYENSQAKLEWDRARGIIDKFRYELENVNLKAFNSVNNRIREKNGKQYIYEGRLFLVVMDSLPLTSDMDIEVYRKRFMDFENTKFDEIWFLLRAAEYSDHSHGNLIFLLDKRNRG